MNLTRLLVPYFVRRAKACREAAMNAETAQKRTLARLLGSGRHTLWGQIHRYDIIHSYADFSECHPFAPYDILRPYIMRMIAGEKDILWPGVTRRFAQSSGTSDGKSKYIPITAAALRSNHYYGAGCSLAMYLDTHRDSRIFDGKSFILGGSYANELDLSDTKAKVGDLSATLIDCVNPLVDMVRVPSRKTALMADWHEKLPALVKESAKANVTNISGVPSWFLTVLRSLLAESGASSVHEVWPNLEVFFHGGIAFGPYRDEYMSITDRGRMSYWENYNASEGFFSAQHEPDNPAMLLLADAGVFYEFIPADNPAAAPIPLWEVEKGKKYSLVITSCNGLWRFPIGDVVRIESVSPVTITIAGRTKSYINAFGEEVMVHNTDAALAAACRACGCSVRDYTVAPVYTSGASKGHHQWLIEFSREPADMERFSATLDKCLCNENSDYQAKRAGGIFLAPLTVVAARRGLFDSWLESTGKLGGQRKVPRLSNDRKIIDKMLELNTI